jgi:hypothetical protein
MIQIILFINIYISHISYYFSLLSILMLQNFRCNEISWIQFGVHVGRNEYGVKVCLYKIGQPSSLSHGFERFNLYHLTSEPNSIGVR